MGLSVVVVEEDPIRAEQAATRLRLHLSSVRTARSCEALLVNPDHLTMDGIVVDLESTQLSAVESLYSAFPAVPIVCTHRVPDEAMWMLALAAGASDMCGSDDGEGIRASLQRSLAHAA